MRLVDTRLIPISLTDNLETGQFVSVVIIEYTCIIRIQSDGNFLVVISIGCKLIARRIFFPCVKLTRVREVSRQIPIPVRVSRPRLIVRFCRGTASTGSASAVCFPGSGVIPTVAIDAVICAGIRDTHFALIVPSPIRIAARYSNNANITNIGSWNGNAIQLVSCIYYSQLGVISTAYIACSTHIVPIGTVSFSVFPTIAAVIKNSRRICTSISPINAAV